MPKGLYVDRPEHVVLGEYDEAPLQAGEVRIGTEFASIKHGTLFHVFSGESPFEDRRFDPDLRLFVARDANSTSGAMVGRFTGHMVVGTVLETGEGVDRFCSGNRVYCYGPMCETVTRREGDVYSLQLPMDELDAVCVDPAFIAYAAVRDARVILGDRIVVFGLGALGLHVVQLLKLAGCMQVIAVDPLPKRRALAERLGAHLTLDPTACDVGVAVREHLGCGADIAIEASGHYRALRDAMRAVTQCARIVTFGYYRGVDTELELGAEWLHNRLELICSMPDWGNPSREHPLWDMGRLWDTVVEMYRRHWLSSDGIVDPIVRFEDAAQAFMSIYRDPSDAIKLGVRFG